MFSYWKIFNNYAKCRQFGYGLVKTSATESDCVSLSGRLYVSGNSSLALSVPNALVRGAFDALGEPGTELPAINERIQAHILVMTPNELKSVGGPDAIKERGHSFSYSLKETRSLASTAWPDISKIWYITVDSSDLRNLRRSYGLSPLLQDDDFRIVFAIRRRNVFRDKP